jgi:long-chain acyl-CoA synthetase
VHLPPHKRVLGYDISFESLPRTTTGKLKRHEIEKRLRQKQHQKVRQQGTEPAAEPSWAGDDPHAAAACAVIAARSRGGAIRPDSNLELDLGLDSMERVELITELEQRFGVRLSDDQAHHVLTVQQLIDAVRPGDGQAAIGDAEDSWAVMLRDLPPDDDPLLKGLLEPRPFAAPIFFVLLRLVRLLARIDARGLEKLPREGPYIISPNHQSYVDPFLLTSVLPYHVFKQLFLVGAAEYFESTLTRWLARLGNLIPVDPDANLVPAMKAGAFGLTHRKVLILFPEGERSIDGTVKRFKKGAPILSRHLNVPIVPVSIRGAFEIWPRNRQFNWKLLRWLSGHRVRIDVGDRITATSGESYAEAAERLRGRVQALWLAASERQGRRDGREDAATKQNA